MDEIERPSKSQLKREAQATRDLGAELIALPDSVLKKMPLSERVRDAVDQARAMRSRGARKRQLGFVSRMLRLEDTSDIEAAIADHNNAGRREAAAQHRVEAWRDALLSEGDQALSTLLDERRDIEASAIRQCIRNAATEAKRGKPPAAARQLFRLLREADQRQVLPGVPR